MAYMTNTPAPLPMGRPSTYTPETANAVCLRLIEGESLRSICSDPDMPDKSTVLRWLHSQPAFRDQYIAARALGAEALVDEVVARALEATPANANATRVAVDTIFRAAASFAPKRWGTVTRNEHSGPDGRPLALQPVPVPMTAPEVQAGIRALLDRSEDSTGLPRSSAPDAERLQTIMASGEILPPDLHAAIYNDESPE